MLTNRSVQISGTPPTLTVRERSLLVQAERTISKGLKSFWEV